MGPLGVPQRGDNGGLHYDSCEKERAAVNQSKFKEVGLTGLS